MRTCGHDEGQARRAPALPALQAEGAARERTAANLLFALVSRRYERGSIVVTSNRGFEQWGEILGDAMVAAALIDRLVHHATMITLKGKSYRRRERGLGGGSVLSATVLRSTRFRRSARTSMPQEPV